MQELLLKEENQRKIVEKSHEEIVDRDRKSLGKVNSQHAQIEDLEEKLAETQELLLKSEDQRKIAEKSIEELSNREKNSIGLINSQKAQIKNLENMSKSLEEKLQKAILQINSSEFEEQNLKNQLEDYKIMNERHLTTLNTQESEVLTLQSDLSDLKKTNENLEKNLQILKQNLEENSQNFENQRLIYEKKWKEFEEQEKSKDFTIKDQQIQLKNGERRIKALTDLMKSFESVEGENSALKTLLKEKQALNAELQLENSQKTHELTELKEFFFSLQENQQEDLMKLISKSAENLLIFSKLKEKNKNQDLNELKNLEKELESYKPSIKSPKLDLILQQQRNLIQQIKETTQKCNINEFEVSPLEETKLPIIWLLQ